MMFIIIYYFNISLYTHYYYIHLVLLILREIKHFLGP